MEPDDEFGGVVLLQRWVEGPDGRMELLERPLTPEDFLNPLYGDKWLQGKRHAKTMAELGEHLERHLRFRPDVEILMDVQHRLGPGLPNPSPDVSVIFGVRNPERDRESFDLVEEGVGPSLILEVISPKDPRIRRLDEVNKVKLYERVGVQEYLLVDLPREATGHRFRLKGYRLGIDQRYQPIVPDAEGFLLSVTTQLRFGVSPAGDRIEIVDAATGERLRSPVEEEEARKAAEAELARLRAEIERLKNG